MDRLRTLNDYEVLRVIPTHHKQHIYKVRKDNRIYRITAVPLKVFSQHPSRQIERIVQLLEKCYKYQQLAHPNVQAISKIFHYENTSENYLAIVGEYSTEGDLEDLIQEVNNKKSYDLRQVMIDLSAGLEYLHGRSIIHTAITPENIRKIDGKYKITFPSFCEIDWFNRKINSLSSIESNAGADDYYTSPEIKKVKFFSFSSDVWSLGIIFYQLLSGKQFRLCSQVRPYEMGNFSQEMLKDVSNGMMRSLLKEMLHNDNKGRIGIDRIKNILINTDISTEDAIEEQIMEERNYHTLTLPIFHTEPSSKQFADDGQKKVQISEHRYIQMAMEGFRAVIIYKSHNDSLQFCLYSYDKGPSFMSQYTYSRLPSSFTQIFSSSHDIFQEFHRETLNIAYLNSFGQFVIVFQQNRYLTFKAAKKQKQEMVLKRPNQQVLYAESSTDSSRKRSLLGNHDQIQSERDKLYRQTVAQYGQNSQEALDVLQQLSKLERFEPNGSLEKSVQYEEKVMNILINQDKFLKNYPKVFASLSKLSQRCRQLRNYVKCIEINQRAYSYFSTYKMSISMSQTLSNLISCNQILNNKQQSQRWGKVLEREYPQGTIICFLKVSMILQVALASYFEGSEERDFLTQKMEVCMVKVIDALQSIKAINEECISRLIEVIIYIFKYQYTMLYEIASIALTKAYQQTKKSSIHQHMSTFIVEELTIIDKKIYAPKCKKTIRKWVKDNMPQKYTVIFDNKKNAPQYSILDSYF